MKSVVLNWGPTLLFSVVLPWVTYGMLTDGGTEPVTALFLIALWPLAEVGIFYGLHRRVDEFGVMILGVLVLGAVSALFFHSEKMVFVKDSAVTGLLGLAFLVTLLLERPVMFYFGRKFATDGSAEGVARWNGFWDAYPGFRSSQRKLTVVWGVAFLVVAGVRIALTYVLDTRTMVGVSGILPFVVLAGLLTYTIRTGKKGRARMAGAGVGAGAGAEGVAAPAVDTAG
ncbi:VC0807 family protein [Streptomyces sp. NPDC087440]|uniref:VC0807 family protein n=1 Tax=Streptomyces sp. NPDC087440 TaxID=3365790 RepID=UPI00381EDAB9